MANMHHDWRALLNHEWNKNVSLTCVRFCREKFKCNAVNLFACSGCKRSLPNVLIAARVVRKDDNKSFRFTISEFTETTNSI
jgi:hypothetical protein